MVAPSEEETNIDKANDTIIVVSDDDIELLSHGNNNNSVIVISDSEEDVSHQRENASTETRTASTSSIINASTETRTASTHQPEYAGTETKLTASTNGIFFKRTRRRRAKRKRINNKLKDCEPQVRAQDFVNKKAKYENNVQEEEGSINDTTDINCYSSNKSFRKGKENVACTKPDLFKQFQQKDDADPGENPSGREHKTLSCPVCLEKLEKNASQKHFLQVHFSLCFKCVTCNMDFKLFDEAYSHRVSESNHAVKCPLCTKMQSNVKQLRKHCIMVHQDIAYKDFPTERCLLFPISCPKKCQTLHDFISHYVARHEPSNLILKCFTCALCHKQCFQYTTGLAHYIKDHNAVPTGNAVEIIKEIGIEQPFKDGETSSKYNTRQSRNTIKVVTHSSSTNQDSKKAALTSTKGKEPLVKKKLQHPHTSSNTYASGLNERSENEQWSHTSCNFLNNLSNYNHIIFIDLDNWAKLFDLAHLVPKNVFIWGFCGGGCSWRQSRSLLYHQLVQEKRYYLHPKCGNVKNAADFALCVQAARLDLLLPNPIPFTVLSGDKGFTELQNQLSSSKRVIHLIDPHRQEPDFLSALLHSIGET